MRKRRGYVLRLPPGVGAEEVARLVERRRRRRRVGPVVVRRGELRIPEGAEMLARGLAHRLGGEWEIPPPAPGEDDETLHDLIRLVVPRKLLPAELAIVLRPLLPGVAIREDERLGLFWFVDEDSELTVSAWTLNVTVPKRLMPDVPDLYEMGIDDVHGPTPETAAEAFRIAELVERELGGVAIDRFGFRVTEARDLMPR